VAGLTGVGGFWWVVQEADCPKGELGPLASLAGVLHKVPLALPCITHFLLSSNQKKLLGHKTWSKSATDTRSHTEYYLDGLVTVIASRYMSVPTRVDHDFTHIISASRIDISASRWNLAIGVTSRDKRHDRGVIT